MQILDYVFVAVNVIMLLAFGGALLHAQHGITKKREADKKGQESRAAQRNALRFVFREHQKAILLRTGPQTYYWCFEAYKGHDTWYSIAVHSVFEGLTYDYEGSRYPSHFCTVEQFINREFPVEFYDEHEYKKMLNQLV